MQTDQKKFYSRVNQRIREELDKGTVPWTKPFFSLGMPRNHKSGHQYQGINLLLLEPGKEYLTFKQVADMGGKVKKGEKGIPVQFWKTGCYQTKETDQQSGAEEIVSKIGTYSQISYVFDIETQVEGVELKPKWNVKPENTHEPFEEAEIIILNYLNRPDGNSPRVEIKPCNSAHYVPALDLVEIPSLEQFEDRNRYYAITFHELTHSTGHKSRENRTFGTMGSSEYAKEELVAEIGACFLQDMAGIKNDYLQNAAYIDHWREKVKELNDDRTLVEATRKAFSATKFIAPEYFKQMEQNKLNQSDRSLLIGEVDVETKTATITLQLVKNSEDEKGLPAKIIFDSKTGEEIRTENNPTIGDALRAGIINGNHFKNMGVDLFKETELQKEAFSTDLLKTITKNQIQTVRKALNEELKVLDNSTEKTIENKVFEFSFLREPKKQKEAVNVKTSWANKINKASIANER